MLLELKQNLQQGGPDAACKKACFQIYPHPEGSKVFQLKLPLHNMSKQRHLYTEVHNFQLLFINFEDGHNLAQMRSATVVQIMMVVTIME